MTKNIFKTLGILIITFLILSASYIVNLFLMKPLSMDHYLAKELVVELIDSPEAMTYVGIFDRFSWLTKHSSKLSIPTESDRNEDISELEDRLKILQSYDINKLSDIQKTTREIAIFDTKNNLKNKKEFYYHDFPLNQIGGIHLSTIEFLNSMHPIRNLSEANALVDRAFQIKAVFEGTRKSLERQAEIGIYPPGFVYDHVVEQLTSFIEYTDEEHPLFTQFVRKIQEINLTNEDRSMLKENLKNAIRTSVTPGFQLLLDFMTEKRILANKNDGVWSLPKGDDYYELRIREYTTTDYTPEQIHQMGLDEVNRISKRMSKILTDLGYDANKNVGEIMNALNENPKFLYADTPDRKEIVISDYTEMVNEAIEVMTDYFYSMPKSPVIVKAVPEYSEKTAAGGYYQAPALDGSRPGVFYANLYDIKQTPTYSMRTLTYHEATPGHHHQIAHSLENEDLTLYRRFGYGTSAFSEGWALYAERLALEAGLAENPYDELGILQSEIFRAVRLVVDTGLHYKKWTREEAMEYMKAITGMSDTEVRVEIERYIVWPGQALSYKVGMIKILELREKAKTLLGDKFNIKDFHSAVLDHGNPPLFVVEKMVNKMIEEAKF